MTRERRYRVRIQAEPVMPETTWQVIRRHWPEIVGGLLIIGGSWYGIPLVLALAAKP